MTIDTEREAFETWARKEKPWANLARSDMPPPTRFYVGIEAQNLFDAWQAARAPLVAELEKARKDSLSVSEASAILSILYGEFPDHPSYREIVAKLERIQRAAIAVGEK